MIADAECGVTGSVGVGGIEREENGIEGRGLVSIRGHCLLFSGKLAQSTHWTLGLWVPWGRPGRERWTMALWELSGLWVESET